MTPLQGDADRPTAEDPGGDIPLVVIPRERAVFWMDGRGRWHNAAGPFRVKRIIDRFHRAIGRDAGGYFVSQANGERREKVYFRYAETPLFAVRVHPGEPPLLELNTGRRLRLAAEKLFIRGDCLYLRDGEEIVKFGERAMMALAERLEMDARGGWHWDAGGRRLPVPVEEGGEGPGEPRGC